MMGSDLNNKMVAVLFAILPIIGALAGFFFYQVLEKSNPDPLKESHEYSVHGTLGGNACVGTGTSDYLEESSREYVYGIELRITAGDVSETVKFSVVFGEDKEPIGKLFNKVGGETTGGMAIGIWTYSYKGTDYTIYTGDNCTVQKIVAVSEGYIITAIMNGGVY